MWIRDQSGDLLAIREYTQSLLSFLLKVAIHKCAKSENITRLQDVFSSILLHSLKKIATKKQRKFLVGSVKSPKK